VIALSCRLYYSTQIPVCLWFLTRDGKRRDRSGQTPFIDARKLGTLVDRVHRDLSDADIARMAGTYHTWRGDKGAVSYADIDGFCKSSTAAEIEAHGFLFTPGPNMGAEAVEDDGVPFEKRKTGGSLIARRTPGKSELRSDPIQHDETRVVFNHG